jgi:Fe-S cluster assembly scaffold protein SufB
MTEATETSPGRRPRRAERRGPADLPLSFAGAGHAAAIAEARGEPAWLAEDRAAATARYVALPVEVNRLYTPYVDLRAASLEAVRPYVLDGPPGLGDDLEGLSLPDGVWVETMSAWLERDPAGFRAMIDGGATLPDDDRLATLSRAFWTHGRHVEIAPGVRVERPIVLRWPEAEPGRALISRTVVTLGDGAEASLVEELVAPDAAPAGAQGLLSATTEIRLGAHARLAMSSLQELGPDQVVFQQRRAEVGEGAELRWALAQLGGRLVRSRVDNVLVGDRSTVEQVEIVFGAQDQLHDLTSYTRHVGRDTTGQLLSKGVLFDKARSYMKGLITIDRSAIGTDSFLGEFGMNLSRTARAVAIPSLEIDQPDCRRAAHSSSVGPIDEGQLFYLESRGIAPDEARKFIVLGFLEPVVARVPLEEAQDRLRDALEAKWSAGLAAGGSATAA